MCILLYSKGVRHNHRSQYDHILFLITIVILHYESNHNFHRNRRTQTHPLLPLLLLILFMLFGVQVIHQ